MFFFSKKSPQKYFINSYMLHNNVSYIVAGKNVEVLGNQNETPPSSSQNTKSVGLEMSTMQCRNSTSSNSSSSINSSSSSNSSSFSNSSSSSSSTSSSSSKSSSSSTHAATPEDVLDSDDSVADKTYEPNHDEDSEGVVSNDDDSSLTPNVDTATLGNKGTKELESPAKKGSKRKKLPEKWGRNLQKKLRNEGKQYVMHTKDKKEREERKVKPPCREKCRLKCSMKFTEEQRMSIFASYWELGDIDRQRQFIANSIDEIVPRYRYVRVGGTRTQRKPNNAFYFKLNEGRVRVCKLFFINTLDINDRPIRTVLEKKNKVCENLIEIDLRGKHSNHHAVDQSIKDGMRVHIDSIPKIESHYLRANTSRVFIDGSKTVADIHRDYVSKCKENNVAFGNYSMFYKVFTEDYNISFFTPKKDQCDTCATFENASETEKDYLQQKYDQHQIEKELSRSEKASDKVSSNAAVAVYDLQAVLQLPKGDVSLFYYKCKLNVLNFTIYDLKSNNCECYVWDESNGHRGVNELGSCVLDYIHKVCETGKKDIIFYSDNCGGQQKNRFMLALYLYAVNILDLDSITHKFLIKGHSQNEGDSAHSLIERQVKRLLKSGPIYVPETFLTAIRMAKKKGEPFRVKECDHEFFMNIKVLANEIGPMMNMKELKISEVKVLKVTKESPNSVFYKHSYNENFKEATVLKKRISKGTFTIPPCFGHKPGITSKKKEDLLDLCKRSLIPNPYKKFYENL